MPGVRKIGAAAALVVVFGVVGGPLAIASSASTPTTIPSPPSQATETNLSQYLAELSKQYYERYEAEVKGLAAKIEGVSRELKPLAEQLQAKFRELSETKDERTREALNREVEALDRRIAELQAQSTELSDQLKAKNLLLQQVFEIMTQVQGSLNKIIQAQGQRIGR